MDVVFVKDFFLCVYEKAQKGKLLRRHLLTRMGHDCLMAIWKV